MNKRTTAAALLPVLITLAGCATGPGSGAPPQAVTDSGIVAHGPYAPAVAAGDLVFVSGQLPFAPDTQALVAGDIEAQTRQVLENIDRLLNAAGTDRRQIVRVTVYLADAADFRGMNAAYSAHFASWQPTRTTVPGITLPPGVRVEIDAIALRGR